MRIQSFSALTLSSTLLLLGACAGDDSGTSDTTTSAATTATTSGSTTGESTSTGEDTTTTGEDTTTTGEDTTTTTGEDTTTTGGETGGAMAMIRVIHLSPDAPAVDVYANGGADPVVEDLAVKNATGYLEVPAGDYTFAIAPADTSLEDAVFTTPPLSLEEGVMYSAVAVGKIAPDEGDGDFNVLALVDSTEGLEAGNVRLQVLHAAAAAAFTQVDVWNLTDPNDPQPLIEDFDFEASGTLDVPSVALVIGLDVDDDGTPDASFAVPALPADAIVDVAAFSDADDVPSLQAAVGEGALTQIDPS